MAAEPQGPAYDAQEPPLTGVGDPMQGTAAPEVPEPSEADPVVDEVRRAAVAGAQLCKAFATGQPEQIDTARFKESAEGVRQLLEGLAKYSPPAKPEDPNAVLKDRTDAAKAVLQDQQHADQMAVQLETARQREGRPSGQAKP